MGPKIDISREIREIAIMHEISKILSPADLRIRDVEREAGGKPSTWFLPGRLEEQSPFQNKNEATETKSSHPTGFL